MISILACRMMSDGTCRIPCYQDEHQCNLTVVKVYLAKHTESKVNPPRLYAMQAIVWHGESSVQL
jgi:hypothetical protein